MIQKTQLHQTVVLLFFHFSKGRSYRFLPFLFSINNLSMHTELDIKQMLSTRRTARRSHFQLRRSGMEKWKIRRGNSNVQRALKIKNGKFVVVKQVKSL